MFKVGDNVRLNCSLDDLQNSKMCIGYNINEIYKIREGKILSILSDGNYLVEFNNNEHVFRYAIFKEYLSKN